MCGGAEMIAYNTENGVSIVVPTGLIPIEDVIAKDVPRETPYIIVHNSPTDRIFRDCWIISGSNIIEDLELSRAKANGMRRVARDNEFMQWDRLATVPSQMGAAEVAREEIRQRYDIMQLIIDGCDTVDELKTAIASII